MDSSREGASDVLFSAGVVAMEVLAALNESLLGVLASGGSVDRREGGRSIYWSIYWREEGGGGGGGERTSS